MLRRIAGVRKWDEVPTGELRQKLGATGLTLAQEQRRRRMRFVGHVLREPTSIINQLLRSTAPGQKKGRKKCFLGEVATEMNTLKERKYGGEVNSGCQPFFYLDPDSPDQCLGTMARSI